MEQIVLYGKGGLETIISQKHIDKVFLICGETTFKQSEVCSLIDSLPVHAVKFSEFSPNPKYEEICCGLKAFKVSESNVILAVGGGSSIDVAKCIRLYASMDCSLPFYKQEGHDTGVLLIAMPTTAGSGSESTCHVVLYRDGMKQSISRNYLRPAYVVLEPEFLHSLPLKQKKSTIMDALCQGIESYWAKNATDESRIYAMEAIQIIVQYWKQYIFENSCYKEIMYASNLAGRAINISCTTAPHALSYGLTAMYGIPHGYAVALCMEQIWRNLLIRKNFKLVESLRNRLHDISAIITYEDFCNIINKMDLKKPSTVDKGKDIEILAKKVNAERLSNHPVILENQDIVNIYERIVAQVEN